MEKLVSIRIDSPGSEVASGRVEAGEVWLVGAGPGDPGLLTLRGRDVLAQADVVVHDRLGCEEILHLVPSSARLVDVGKRPGGGSITQVEINEALASEAAAGNRVVRLKGGDPFIYGRGMEELLFLHERDIPCHVVPGVSSAIAAPAAAGIPLTHRHTSHGFTVGTGHTGEGSVSTGSAADTRVYLMAVGAIGEIVAQLRSEGIPAGTPTAVITNATTYRQRIVRATLETIGEATRCAGLTPPGVLVVGECVGIAAGEQWNTPHSVLVTSTRVPELLRQAYPEYGMLWRPLLRIEAVEEAAGSQGLARSLAADWLLFTNPHAATEYLRLLRRGGLDVRRMTAHVAAVGVETVAALQGAGIIADLPLVDGSQEGLLRELRHHIVGGRVVIPGAEGSMSRLAMGLGEAGAREIVMLPLYRYVQHHPGVVEWDFVEAVFFASPSGVKRFREVFAGAPVDRLVAVAMGESTASLCQEAGFARVDDLANREQLIVDGIDRAVV